jgi:hypothetical protein
MVLRNLLEKLLAGQFICQFTNDTAFNHLLTKQGRVQVNNAMSSLERELVQLPNDGAFYLSLISPDKKADQISIRKHFEALRDKIEPVISFLVFVSRAKPEFGILSPGQVVRFSDLLNVITHTDQHIKQLNKLVTMFPFKTSKQGTEEKLKAVINGMISEGLLVEKNEDGLIYQVTGKLDYIHNVLSFIAENENIDLESDDVSDDPQSGLAI